MIICSPAMLAILLLKMVIDVKSRLHLLRVILRCRPESRSLSKKELLMWK